MRRRNLGNTGIQVSELGLGTWGLSGDGYGAVAEEDKDLVLERALSLDINVFETADCYGRGAMEKKLGEKLPESAVVVTKLGTDRSGKPPRKRFDREFLRASLETSRERLRRERLDVVLLHNPSVAAVKRGEAAETMAGFVEEGLVRAWGISAGSAEVVTEALAKDHVPQVVQLAYNLLLSQHLTQVRGELEARQIGVLARSVLAHGMLCGYWGTNRRFPREDHRLQRWTQDQFERRLKELIYLRAATSLRVPSLRSLALKFVLDEPLVGAAILGPKNVVQLDQLVREAGTEPPYLDEQTRQKLEIRRRDAGVTE